MNIKRQGKQIPIVFEASCQTTNGWLNKFLILYLLRRATSQPEDPPPPPNNAFLKGVLSVKVSMDLFPEFFIFYLPHGSRQLGSKMARVPTWGLEKRAFTRNSPQKRLRRP
jgi:hypothetical protein